MEKSSFFNAVVTGVDESGLPKYDRSYKAENFAEFFASFIGNGVFPNPATGLQVVATDNNMNIRIKAGKAWINGYYYVNTDDCIHTIEVADSLLNRIDRVVLRLDFINREIKSYVKKGAFSSTPVAPTLQRDADAYEICLSEVKVNKGIIKISQVDITDTRLNNSLCGIVHGTIDQVDTSEIFRQFQSWYTQKKNEYDTDITNWTTEKKNAFDNWYTVNITEFLDRFNKWYTSNIEEFSNRFNNWYTTNTTTWENDWTTWFGTVKEQLTGDVAGNLLLKIQEASNKIDNLTTDIGDKTLLNTEVKDSIVASINEVNERLDTLNTNDIQSRQEIMDIKLKLEEKNILDFLNKTGIGFYDLFKTMESIDTLNTTATVNNVTQDVTFNNLQKLKFNNITFSDVSNIEIALYDKTREKIQVINGTTNTNQITVLLPPNSKAIGDTLFFNGQEYKINQITKAI